MSAAQKLLNAGAVVMAAPLLLLSPQAVALQDPATAPSRNERSIKSEEVQQPVAQNPAADKPAARTESAKPAQAAVCGNCGVITSIKAAEQSGEATGLGAVAGGVVGGLLGNQVGQGRGKTAATVVGAAGGAYAGHQVEKQMKKAKRYDVSVKMDDGSTRVISQKTEPAFKVGDKVKIVEGALVAN